MRWLRLQLELTTPCFLAGSDSTSANEEILREEGLRPASLVGQWRYWLRAALGGRPGWQEREDLLFGSQHRTGRQGAVWLRPGLSETALQTVARGRRFTAPDSFEEDGMAQSINPLSYLLGQGLYDFKAGLTRPALAAGQVVPVEVTIRPIPGQDTGRLWGELRQVLWLWQAFGGLGSRCRRGWGSIGVSQLEGETAIADEAERARWREWFASPATQTWTADTRRHLLRRFLDIAGDGEVLRNATAASTGSGTDPHVAGASTVSGEPGFAQVGSAYVWLPGQSSPTWEAALGRVGLAMLRARSNAPGRPRPATTLRVQDHDAVSDLLHRRTAMRQAPFRTAFGLPHNYFFKWLFGKISHKTRG